MMERNNLCPVCGYGMEEPPTNYNICPSCGTEFGIHDVNASILSLRQNWFSSGPKWWSSVDPKPPHWNPLRQLATYLARFEVNNPVLQENVIYLSEPVAVPSQISIVKQPNSQSTTSTATDEADLIEA